MLFCRVGGDDGGVSGDDGSMILLTGGVCGGCEGGVILGNLLNREGQMVLGGKGILCMLGLLGVVRPCVDAGLPLASQIRCVSSWATSGSDVIRCRQMCFKIAVGGCWELGLWHVLEDCVDVGAVFGDVIRGKGCLR